AGRLGPRAAGVDERRAGTGSPLDGLAGGPVGAPRAVRHALAVVAVAGDGVEPTELRLVGKDRLLEDAECLDDPPGEFLRVRLRLGDLVLARLVDPCARLALGLRQG